jgi:dolichol kinase
VKNQYGLFMMFAAVLLLYTSYHASRIQCPIVVMSTSFGSGVAALISALILMDYVDVGDK